MKVIDKIFGTHSDRELKRIAPLVDKIESLRPAMMELSDEGLRAKTAEFPRGKAWMLYCPRHMLLPGRRQEGC